MPIDVRYLFVDVRRGEGESKKREGGWHVKSFGRIITISFLLLHRRTKKWARRLPLVLFFKESLPSGSAFLLARSMTSPFSIPHSLVGAAVTF